MKSMNRARTASPTRAGRTNSSSARISAPYPLPAPRCWIRWRASSTSDSLALIAFSKATSLEDFLAGVPSAETIAAGSNVRNISTNQIAAFFQDDWRIKPRLTLNLGIREEIITPPTSNTDNLGNFSPTSPTGIVAVTHPFNTHYHFEPRIGFAWDVTGKGTTTLRAGAGVLNALITLMNFISGGGTGNFDTVPTGETIYPANGSPMIAPGDGKSASVSLLPTSSGGIVTSSPIVWPTTNTSTTLLFPASIFSSPGCGNGIAPNPNPCTMSGGDPNLHYYQYTFWNVNLQHAFTNNFSIDVGYVGSRTTGILQTINLNQAPATNNTALADPSDERRQATITGMFRDSRHSRGSRQSTTKSMAATTGIAPCRLA